MADAAENGNVDVDHQDPQDGDQNKKLSLAEKRKLRKKKSKQNKQQLREQQSAREQQRAQQKEDATKLEAEEEKVEILYVSEPLSLPGAKESGTETPAAAGEQAEAEDDTANEDNSSEPAAGAGAAEEQAMEEDEGQEDGAAPTAGLGLGFVRAAPKPAAERGADEDADEPYSEFLRIFQKFGTAEQVTGAEPFGDEEEEGGGEDEGGDGQQAEKGEEGDDEKDSDDEDEDGKPKLSKKQQKMQSQMQIAALKQTCLRPEVVEVWDVTAPDPTLLVYLKAYRNTVTVPRHWSQKRKYLQGKRGIEKPAFALPEFIEATGIGEMRQAYHEKEEAKKLKQKQKDLMRPKMGRLDLDYQILHDAFFKHQTKPTLSGMGSLYYEGKEFEAKPRNVRAGVLSEATRAALGMSNGAPPPWLINMQRYGPPPSYPHLSIPGLNAPIPQGAEFGYQPGGWGKPPVNEAGEPLYGDVFGERGEDEEPFPAVDKAFRWGDLESEEESEEEEEEEEEEGEPEGDAAAEAQLADGIASGIISGITSSLPSGLETPSEMELRKGMRSSSTMGGADSEAPQLYQVLPQKQAVVGSDLMGSSHVYQLPGQGSAAAAAPAGAAARQMMDMLGRSGGGGAGDVSLALDPSELEGLDDAELKQRYEAEIAARKAGTAREDFSDMVAAKAAAQKRKLAQKQSESAKKHKDFKF